jgi:glycosyltransferase involved in cell wall biosynthesis
LKKKIVLHIAYSGLGGQTNVALSVPDADLNSVFSHHFIFYGIEKVHDHNLRRAEDIKSIDNITQVKKNVGIDIKSLNKLLRIIKSSRPDVIISHMPSVFLPLFFYQIIRKVKVVFVEHHSIQLRSKFSFLISNFNLFFADKIICLTDSYKTQYISKMFITPDFLSKKVGVQANAINESKFFKEKKAHNENKTISHITMIGRFNTGKDHSTLLKAISILITTGHTLKVSLPGDGETLNEIKELCSSLNLNSIVTFPGMISETEVIEVLRNSDVFVLATAGETQSLSILQAMACEVPVVASKVSGVRDMIEDGETGMLYEHGNAADLAKKIRILLDVQEVKETVVKHASDYFNVNHSFKSFFIGYKNIIEKE